MNLSIFIYGQLDGLFIWSTNALRARLATNMADTNESVDQITSACAIATQALEAIGNLQCRDIRNLASSTATGSVSSSCNPSTSGSSAIAAELGRRFPTFNARGGRPNSRKRSSSTSNHETSRSQSSKFGRPLKSIVHRDLVIIPNPSTNQVPSHANKVKLEEKGLIIHEFPFDRRWTPLDLKRNIESQLPRKDILFDYLKVSMGNIRSSCHVPLVVICRPFYRYTRSYLAFK